MGYLDEDPSVVVPPMAPDQSIASRLQPQPFVPPPEDSITAQVGNRLRNVSALASTVNPMGTMLAHGVGTGIGDRYLAAQQTRDPTSFQRDEVTQLQPMNTPLVDVQAAPTLAQTASQYRMAPGMGVGGGVGGPDYRGQIAEGEKGQLGAMTKARDAQAREGVGLADRTERTADLELDDAQKAAAMWENAEAREADVNRSADEFFQRNAQMANEIATAKVDSNRLFKNMSTAESVTMGIGAVLGGMMSGLRGGGPNEFMQSIDRMVDRDVADQQSAIEGKRAGLAARQNMYNQLLQQTGDRRLAAVQLKNLQLEAIKAQTKAKAEAMKTPEILAQSDKLIAGIEGKQAELQTVMAQHHQQQAQAAAAATANARAVAEEKAFQRQVKLTELGQKQDELNIKRAEAGIAGPGATGPLAGVPKDLRSEAAKELQAHAAAEKGIAGIQDSFKKWDETSILSPNQLAATKATIANELKATLGPGLSSDKDFDTYIAPNLPAYGDTAATLAHKQANMAALIRGKVATPILDQTQPGWRMPATVKVKK